MIRHATLTFTAASILAVCVRPYCLVAAEPESSDGELKEMLAGICRKHNVPSLTIAVVRPDGLVTTQCSGVRKRGTDDAVELSDRHPLGSCTKSMTATVAAVLVEAGKIGWDTTISQAWPRAGEKSLHPALRDVTLDQLLSHQSGLASDMKEFKGLKESDWLSFFEEKADPELERRRMLKLILPFKPEHPRGEYHYSNLGFVIAAAMLEAKAGDSFENLMRAECSSHSRWTRLIFARWPWPKSCRRRCYGGIFPTEARSIRGSRAPRTLRCTLPAGRSIFRLPTTRGTPSGI